MQASNAMNETNKKYITDILPWTDVVICVEAPEEVTEHGVALGGSSQYEDKKKPEKGIVVAVGPLGNTKEISEEVKKMVAELKPGDLIFYERYTRNEIADGTTQYNFVHMKNLLGKKKGVVKI